MAASYFDAFWELSTDRQIGFAIGPIPFSAIDRYATRYGYDEPDAFRVLRAMIREMDDAYLEVRGRKTTGGDDK